MTVEDSLQQSKNEFSRGRFGRFGGRYVPETLVTALDELEHAYAAAQNDTAFQKQLDAELRKSGI